MVRDIIESRLSPSCTGALTISIPSLAVITTDFFDAFMKENDLYQIAYSEQRDDVIALAFQKGNLPVRLVGDLRALVEQLHTPLAIRSSSMLEDAMFEPFASVYGTKMVPNNQPDADSRFRKLSEAIKYVYASTFFKAARNYMKATHHTTMDEKMAVIIQEVVGHRFDGRFYPQVSGVLRSFNFYPPAGTAGEDGIVELALGLGRTIVDEGVSWAYSPASPRTGPPFKSMGDMLKHTQTRFWAINMGKPPEYNPLSETEYMIKCELADAEYDGSLRCLASTYNPADDRLQIGTGEKGPRVLNFAPILQMDELPLNDLLRAVKQTSEEMLGTMVEVEFAVKIDRRGCSPAQCGFLQVRPMVVSHATVDITDHQMKSDRALVASESVLGNGTVDDIRDVVYVDPESFDIMRTREIVPELDRANAELLEARRRYLLIGFGRWGTTDANAGIPADFGQISGAKVIVEAALPEVPHLLSQGSHFFHNITSFKIFYFSVPHDDACRIDWAWLRRQPCRAQGKFVRHVELGAPLDVRVDGRSARGVILHD